MQLLVFTPRMAPLAHIHAYVDNMMAQRWPNRGSVSAASSVRTTLWELYLAARRKHIYAFIGRVPREDNKMADAASRLIQPRDRKFLSHFLTHFPQSKPWCLTPLSSTYRRNLTTILHNNL